MPSSTNSIRQRRNTAKQQLEYEADVDLFHKEAMRQDADFNTRKLKLEAAQKWFSLRKDEAFFVSLNSLFAELVERKRAGRRSSPVVESSMTAVRQIRRELGERAIRLYGNSETGVIVLPVELSGGEILYMVLGTGADRVTVSNKMIRVLGLSSRLGDTVETRLAAGIRVKAQEIVFPGFRCSAPRRKTWRGSFTRRLMQGSMASLARASSRVSSWKSTMPARPASFFARGGIGTNDEHIQGKVPIVLLPPVHTRAASCTLVLCHHGGEGLQNRHRLT